MNLNSFIPAALIVVAFIAGYSTGSTIKEGELTADFLRIQNELNDKLNQNLQQSIEKEREYQEFTAELDKKAQEAQRKADAEIANLNKLIASYRDADRMRDDVPGKCPVCPVPTASSTSCERERARTSQWRRAFENLAQLAAILATERDQIAREKNELVKTYEKIRHRTQPEGKAGQAKQK